MRMDTVVVAVAKYALLLVALGAAFAWWQASRRDKGTMVLAGVLTLLLVWVGITVAAHAWTDPRPFVVDGQAPLIGHVADNGFPSDHTTLGAAVAFTVLAWRRWLGAALFVVSLAVGAARVAAGIHHVPDILGGLGIGLVSAVLGVTLARTVVAQVLSRRDRSRAEVTPR